MMKMYKCQACGAGLENIEVGQINAVCSYCRATTKIEDNQASFGEINPIQMTAKGKLTEAGKEQIKQLFRSLNMRRTHFFLERIPIKKLDRFKRLFQTDFTDSEEVIFLHDSSIIQWFGKSGFLLTTKGLYTTNGTDFWTFIAIRDIELITTRDSSIGFDIHYSKRSLYNKKGIIETENDKTWVGTTNEPQLWRILTGVVDLLKNDVG